MTQSTARRTASGTPNKTRTTSGQNARFFFVQFFAGLVNKRRLPLHIGRKDANATSERDKHGTHAPHGAERYTHGRTARTPRRKPQRERRLDCIGVSHLPQTQTQAGTQAQAQRRKRPLCNSFRVWQSMRLQRKFLPGLGVGVEIVSQTQAGTQARPGVGIGRSAPKRKSNFQATRKRRFLNPLSSPFS